MSKGSRRRPMAISQEEYIERWRLAFGPDEDEEDFVELSGLAEDEEQGDDALEDNDES